MSQAYVAIDLELLDPTDRGQEILEVGAIRFRGSRIEDELSLVVKTRGPVSPRIAALTGIGAAELATAVPLAEALAALAHFVDQDPVVGQSVELDIQHLQASGLSARNPLLDTYELATMLLPGLPAYELSRIAETLAVMHDERRHRALPDARLAMRVFLALVQRIEQLDARILSEIVRLGRPLDWPALELFETAWRRKMGSSSAFDLAATFRDDASDLLARMLIPRSSRELLSPSEEPRPVSISRLESFLSAGGDVASRLAGFEERPEQLEMLRA
ncbi:MAG: 3'-5' exonuclease, partial [Chloroflexi bacterium]|nr:3'-5' exonuclease [Chloroflexota bacterium]